MLSDSQSGGASYIITASDGAMLHTVRGYDRVLLQESIASAERATEAHQQTNSTTEAGATAASILCAAACCEAWLSEFVTRGEMLKQLAPDLVDSLRSEQDAAKQWKTLLKSANPETPLPGGSKYNAMACLMQLRNLIAHRNARFQPIDSFPEHLENCVRTKVLPVREATGADWTSVVFVHEVAAWASATAVDWISAVEKELPNTSGLLFELHVVDDQT